MSSPLRCRLVYLTLCGWTAYDPCISTTFGCAVCTARVAVYRRCSMAKVLRCRDVGLDCEGELRGQTEEDILRQAAEHAQNVHNIQDMSPDLVQKVRAAIRDE
jgi:predicted small metal-binding protein